ncbi:1-(5-phosphoribosyl)-5-[(5-phosphoribosylamino)methylideneamino]imidazole-4-carboxamide isomerase [candidate division KSB1 bacterium]|nr:1-(5-phosphoribosyl)-5-[(5-phosphoribosylamino)methylideneamino]imidazole-4-carboxamide isomerase [candidate division KSB1 bacterium]
MEIIPAIDIKDGKCVRLLQGDYQAETIYAENPAEVAKKFQDAGAKRLHLVDLNGALDGKLVNLATISRIISSIQIPAQLGGGIRSLDTIQQVLDAGVGRIILGTIALKQPELVGEAIQKFGPEKIIIGIDARSHKVAISGWKDVTEIDEITFALKMKEMDVQRINYTDISRDGMLTGPNLKAIKNMAIKTDLKITASGGVSSIKDIDNLKQLEPFGVDSVIVGKAIYEKKVALKDLF